MQQESTSAKIARPGIIVAADDGPAFLASLYGMPIAAAEEHHRAFQKALEAGEPVELGEYECSCSYCREVRNSRVS